MTPKKEWDVIQSEEPDTTRLLTGYVLPLAGAAAIAGFIGYAFIGINVLGFKFTGTDWGLYQGVSVLANALLSLFVSSFVIDMLAQGFGSEKNMGKSVQLVAYSMTPVWVGGLLTILPSLGIIGALFGLYGLYLLYEGLPKMKKTPADKHVTYFVVSLFVTLLVYIIIGKVLVAVLMPAFGLSYDISGFKMNF